MTILLAITPIFSKLNCMVVIYDRTRSDLWLTTPRCTLRIYFTANSRTINILDIERVQCYRKCVLESGGSRDSFQNLVDFLGREPSVDAFYNSLLD